MIAWNDFTSDRLGKHFRVRVWPLLTIKRWGICIVKQVEP